jgi:uncharacterized protein involved in type VI secretion and phage assembly
VNKPYRAQSLERRLYGVCVGLVEDNDDPEREGRIKVRFPWLDDATVSEWCRVMQPYAGPGYGAFLVPEKQSEVLIAHMFGYLDEPVVLGCLYNGEDKPAAHHDGTRSDVKLLRTRAGHVLRFDDSDQARAVEVKTAGGHDLVLDDQNKRVALSTSLGQTITLDDQAAKIELSAAGGAGKITIEASGKITLQGTLITLSAAQISLGG